MTNLFFWSGLTTLYLGVDELQLVREVLDDVGAAAHLGQQETEGGATSAQQAGQEEAHPLPEQRTS